MTRFYCDVLGCKVERARQDIGLIQLRAGQSMIDLVPVDGELGRKGGAAPGAEGRNSIISACASSRGIRSRSSRISSSTAWCRARPSSAIGADGNGPSIYITDPEGNGVELKGPPGIAAEACPRFARLADYDPEGNQGFPP